MEIRLNYLATPAGICEAARDGDVGAIDRILADRPELLVIDNPHNWTKTVDGHEVRGSFNKKPVEVAAFFNQPQAVAKLLEISRDSHAIGKPWDDHLPFDGHFNCLGVALSRKHGDVVDVIEADLLKRIYVHPKLLNQADGDGQTVLYYAASQGHVPLVRTLLERGAEPDPQVRSGRRVIHALLDRASVATEECCEVAKLLIEKGADYDLWVATALNDACRVRELLASDPELAQKHYRPDRARLSDGFPLVRACAAGNLEIVELLLDHGADVNCDLRPLGMEDPPEFGMAIVAAMYAKHYDVAHLLLDRGASVVAYPNCAAPFVDMLYYASVDESPNWLALSELTYVTDDPGSHLQSSDAGSTEALKLYERVLSLGGRPQMDSHVKMKNYREIKRLLQDEPTATGQNPAGPDTIYNCLSHAAAWLGDARTMEMCLTLQPDLHSPDAANQHLRAAIRSHNRDGSFADYRRIVKMNLDYLRNVRWPSQTVGNRHPNTDGQGRPSYRFKLDEIDPLWLLADDFLENYSYGTNPDLPAMDDLLSLADLFLENGADIDKRHANSGRTPLAQAVAEGHTRYVEFLLDRGATIARDDPPGTNPIMLAQQHGFTSILELLGESVRSPSKTVADRRSSPDDMREPSAGRARMVRLDHAIIRLGVARIDEVFHAGGNEGVRHSRFVEFPEPFPDDRFDDVRLIITNRNNPQIIGSATTGFENGVQGFTLTARLYVPKDEAPRDDSSVIDGMSFSWMAVLPTDQRQESRFEVRYGLIPWREYVGHELHEYNDVGKLYAEEPFSEDTGAKFVFLTTTTSNVINGSASVATETGVADLAGYQVSRHDGGGRMYYLVIAERPDPALQSLQDAPLQDAPLQDAPLQDAPLQDAPPLAASAACGYFNSENLWIHTSRAEPVRFYPTGMFCAWRIHWMRFLRPFRDRKPCVFVSANSHGIDGHHSSVVAMSRDCTQETFSISGLSFDPVRGEANFDCVAIGHCDTAPSEVALADQEGIPAPTGWKRYLACACDEVAYELAALGEIGVNEFGDHGGSLLMHAIYERHERVHTALARRLLALGADPNQCHPETHLTPLHLAAALGRRDMVNLLIERGANVNAVSIAGTTSQFPTPFECERIRRKPLRAHVGETPLHLAMLQRNFAIAQQLLDAGADPNAQDVHGARPIDYLPNWHTYPDNEKHWNLINRRERATKEDLVEIIRWIQSRV